MGELGWMDKQMPDELRPAHPAHLAHPAHSVSSERHHSNRAARG
jgi:hypothetical protein